MVTGIQIQMQTGQQRPIVMEQMHSQPTQRNGAMRTMMALEAILMETMQMIVPTKPGLQPKINTVVLTVTMTVTQTQAIHSQMTERSGKMLMEITMGTIRMETILISSPTMHHNGEIPTVMATEIILVETMVIDSRMTLHSGPTLTTMGMVTTLSILMAMAFLKEILTFVLKHMAIRNQQHPVDVQIPTGTVSPTLKMHFRTYHSSGLTKMVMDSETMSNSPMVMSVSKSMVRAQKTVFRDAQIPMEMDMLIRLVIS